METTPFFSQCTCAACDSVGKIKIAAQQTAETQWGAGNNCRKSHKSGQHAALEREETKEKTGESQEKCRENGERSSQHWGHSNEIHCILTTRRLWQLSSAQPAQELFAVKLLFHKARIIETILYSHTWVGGEASQKGMKGESERVWKMGETPPRVCWHAKLRFSGVIFSCLKVAAAAAKAI